MSATSSGRYKVRESDVLEIRAMDEDPSRRTRHSDTGIGILKPRLIDQSLKLMQYCGGYFSALEGADITSVRDEKLVQLSGHNYHAVLMIPIEKTVVGINEGRREEEKHTTRLLLTLDPGEMVAANRFIASFEDAVAGSGGRCYISLRHVGLTQNGVMLSKFKDAGLEIAPPWIDLADEKTEEMEERYTRLRRQSYDEAITVVDAKQKYLLY